MNCGIAQAASYTLGGVDISSGRRPGKVTSSINVQTDVIAAHASDHLSPDEARELAGALRRAADAAERAAVTVGARA